MVVLEVHLTTIDYPELRPQVSVAAAKAWRPLASYGGLLQRYRDALPHDWFWAVQRFEAHEPQSVREVWECGRRQRAPDLSRSLRGRVQSHLVRFEDSHHPCRSSPPSLSLADYARVARVVDKVTREEG